jgi:hypothetical protein
MPVDRVTAQQFAQNISDDILGRNSGFDVTYGPVRDIVIRPPSRVFESQNDSIRKAFELLSLLNVDSMNESDLDDFVYNEGLVRSSGSKSVTTVIFSRTQVPVSDITVPVNFSLATTTDPATGIRIQFVTTESKTMYSSSPGLYFNATTGKYELEVGVSAIVSGVNGNVGSGRISVALRGLVDFESVTNRVAAYGGTDRETNQQLVQRYLIRILGTDISTTTGIKRFVEDFFVQVLDTEVSYGSDSLLTREDTDAGAVDFWVLGDTVLSATDTKLFPGRDHVIVLDKQPVRNVSSVSDGVTTYVLDTDYIFVEDSGIYSRSYKGSSGIKFLQTGAAPTLNVGLTIVYSYNSLVSSLQSYFTTPTYLNLGRDLLFREGEKVEIVLTGTLSVSSGDPTTVLNNVLTAISTFVNTVTGSSGGLKNQVEQFDIDREIAKVQGVDNFVFSQLSRYGSSGVQDISIQKNEYARISSANLNVVLA